jgi:hypothetical protein
MTEAYSLKPWIRKVEEIESHPLFAPLVGDCPCITTCLGDRPHSGYVANCLDRESWIG